MKKLVYIVEDNPIQQKMLQVHFEQMLGEYSVRTFSNPDDMFTHLSEKPFAIVLDHFFDDKHTKTGLDYLKDLKRKYQRIPVIYYTTLDDDSVRQTALSLGVEQYIIKDSASLVRLRTALDTIKQRGGKKGILGKLFGQ